MDIITELQKNHKEIEYTVTAMKTAKEIGHGQMFDQFKDYLFTLLSRHVELMVKASQIDSNPWEIIPITKLDSKDLA